MTAQRLSLVSCRMIAVSALLLRPAAAGAQGAYIGFNKCIACHDHERQANKWKVEEPAQLGDKAHYRTLRQLQGAKAAAYAKALGYANPDDLGTSCVKCHATVYKGAASAGVSCESCHGAASGYLEVHQAKDAYTQAVSAGMHNLRRQIPTIARLCVGCHVTTDQKLIAAGHPSGANFDAGVNLGKIVHWSTTYDLNQVSQAAQALKSKTAAVTTPSPRAGGSAPPTSVTPVPQPSAGPSRPAPAAGCADPWNFDCPVPELPPDKYTSPEPTASKPPARTANRGIGIDPISLPSAAVVQAAPAPPPKVKPGPDLATVRGKSIALLDSLLRKQARAPELPPPVKPKEFKGSDNELLRLQDEVFALALEALRRQQ
jgi:hypothetical protein